MTGTTPAESSDTSPTASPTPSPSAPAAVQIARILPGRLFYRSNTSPVQIYAWDGGTVAKILQPLDTSWFTARISPDGRKLAWVSDDDQLLVANIDGSGGIRKVLDNVHPVCSEPVWTADSRRVIARPRRAAGGGLTVEELGYVDVDSGSFQPIEVRGCHPTLAPGDAYLATASTGVRVARADGTSSRVVPVLGSDDPKINPEGARTGDIHSLSPDGNLLICSLRTGDQPSGDGVLDPFANAVIDTRTGKQVALPVAGQLINAVFLTDGSLLARLQGSTRNELVLISKDWKVVDRLQEPADLKHRPLLAYIPA